MELEHFGEIVNMDPAAAALDESIVRALRLRGPTSQRDLWFRSSAQNGSREEFLASLDRLVEEGRIIRQGTPRKNRFIFRMAPDKRRAAKREAALEVQP